MKNDNNIAISNAQNEALFPTPPNRYIAPKIVPNIFPLGTLDNDKIFAIKIRKETLMNCICIGSQGSGKTLFLISLLLALQLDQQNKITRFVIDPKNSELARKTCDMYNDPFIHVVSPTDNKCWGWDVYFKLNQMKDEGKPIRDDDVLHVADQVARALITSHDPKDKFFINSSRRILKGMLLYYWWKERWIGIDGEVKEGFADALNEIDDDELQKKLKEILEDKSTCKSHPKIKKLLRKYSNMKGETFESIAATLSENLDFVINDEIMWCLKGNPRKANPTMLNEGISIYWSSDLDKIDEYSCLMRLATYQTIATLESRKEDDADNNLVAVIIEEAHRIGKLDNLNNAISVSRGLGFFFVICTQDEEQLSEIYNDYQANTLWNTCRIKIICGTENTKTIKKMSDLAGRYEYPQMSAERNGLLQFDSIAKSVTYVEKDIVDAHSVTTLIDREEIIVFISGQYYRVKQLRYFKDEYLNHIVQKNLLTNSSTIQLSV